MDPRLEGPISIQLLIKPDTISSATTTDPTFANPSSARCGGECDPPPCARQGGKRGKGRTTRLQMPAAQRWMISAPRWTHPRKPSSAAP
jgi:hypothetical protein